MPKNEYTKKELFDILYAMRRQFAKEMENTNDKKMKLILKAKAVTITQVMDELRLLNDKLDKE